MDHILKDLKFVKSLRTFDLKDLFNNIDLLDLYAIINALLKEIQHQFSVPVHVDAEYLYTLTNFIIYDNYIHYTR